MSSLDARIAAYESLIHRVVHSAGCPMAWHEDASQEARLAVWRALLSYDPAQGCRESTWVWVRVHAAVCNYLRAEGTRATGRSRRRAGVQHVSLDALRETEETPQPAPLHRVLPEPDDPAADAVSRVAVREFARRLTPAERAVLRLFAQGYRGSEIARRRGTSPSAVSAHRQSIRRKWREVQ